MNHTAADAHQVTLAIAAPMDAVRDAIIHPERWWTPDVRRDGDELTVRFRGDDDHATRFRLEDDGLQWECVDQNEASFDDPREWVGTRLEFTLEPDGDTTRLLFAHTGLRALECFDRCQAGWAACLPSLRDVAEGREGTLRGV